VKEVLADRTRGLTKKQLNSLKQENNAHMIFGQNDFTKEGLIMQHAQAHGA